MEKAKTLEQLRAEKERAETQLAQEQHMLPFFMLAMYEKHGQPLEKIVGNIIKVAVIRPKERPYKTNNFYAVLERQEKLDKEVYDIVHRKEKPAGR